MKEVGGTSHNSGIKTDNSEWRWQNLELPMFDVMDVAGWVEKFERYFRLKGAMEEEKVEIALVSLEGKALTWFLW